MKIPKRPNFNKRPYPSNEEIEEWHDFITFVLTRSSLIVSIISLTVVIYRS